MAIYSFICTRDSEHSETTKDLISFYQACGIKVKTIVGVSSIFSGYKAAFKEINPNNEDLVGIQGFSGPNFFGFNYLIANNIT